MSTAGIPQERDAEGKEGSGSGEDERQLGVGWRDE